MDTLPAGEYYIGDPCYVIDDNKWMAFVDAFREEGEGGMFEFEGHGCTAFYTRWGDGLLIGIIPIALCAQVGHGSYVTMDRPFTCGEFDGALRFGDYSVQTNDEEEEDCCAECGSAL